MMAGQQPEFAKVKKRTAQEAHYERLQKYVEEQRTKKAEEEQEQQKQRQIREIAHFILNTDRVDDIPIVFNMISGQVVARRDALEEKSDWVNKRASTFREDYVRVRADDGFHILKSCPHRYVALSPFADLELEFPAWFYERSDELLSHMAWVMRRVRFRVLKGRIGEFRAW